MFVKTKLLGWAEHSEAHHLLWREWHGLRFAQPILQTDWKRSTWMRSHYGKHAIWFCGTSMSMAPVVLTLMYLATK